MKRQRNAIIFSFIFLGLLFSTACGTSEEVVIFDFTGTWTLSTTWDSITDTTTLTLTGGLTNGLATTSGTDTGTYTSANNQITMTFYLGPLIYTFNGTVTATNHMSGTFTVNLIGGTGTWLAVR